MLSSPCLNYVRLDHHVCYSLSSFYSVPSSVSADGVVWAMGLKRSAVGLCIVSEVRIIQTQQSVERELCRGFSLFLVTVFCQVTTARNE